MPYASVEAFRELRDKACDSHFLQAHRTKRRRTGTGTSPTPPCADSSYPPSGRVSLQGLPELGAARPAHRKIFGCVAWVAPTAVLVYGDGSSPLTLPKWRTAKEKGLLWHLIGSQRLCLRCLPGRPKCSPACTNL